MHELSVCQAQVENLAREHRAKRVADIRLQIGPLVGVGAGILQKASPIATTLRL